MIWLSRRARAALAGVALTALLGGCGLGAVESDGSVDSPTTSTSTRRYLGGVTGSGLTGSGSNGNGASTPTTARRYIPYEGNGGGPTRCRDGTWSNSSGRGTCSHHGGIAR